MFRIFCKQPKPLVVLTLLVCIFSPACDEVLQKSLADTKVLLITPGDNVTTASPVNFSWEAIASAEQYRIRIMSPSFDSLQVLIFDSLVSRNIVALPLAIGKYQWKVQSINSSSVSQESEARDLTIE